MRWLFGLGEQVAARIADTIAQNPKKMQRAGKRVVEVATEIGLLLIVFTPLETLLRAEPSETIRAAKTAAPRMSGLGWLFFVIGVTLIIGALILEWRYLDGSDSDSPA